MESDRVYQRIAASIREKILNNSYPVSSRIPPERELASQLQVSRTSVREAIIALEVSGWVEVRLGSGVYVRQRAPAQVNHEDPPVHPKLLPHLATSTEV
ncbi:MAG: FadR/GntR family transcriptional regulator, partial [Advenella sp.]|uniref:FadR/GntR family transcriptional regulator n=1 Tax=Advenella sp. TaxID=1872388 RepID=UPI003F9714E6